MADQDPRWPKGDVLESELRRLDRNPRPTRRDEYAEVAAEHIVFGKRLDKFYSGVKDLLYNLEDFIIGGGETLPLVNLLIPKFVEQQGYIRDNTRQALKDMNGYHNDLIRFFADVDSLPPSTRQCQYKTECVYTSLRDVVDDIDSALKIYLPRLITSAPESKVKHSHRIAYPVILDVRDHTRKTEIELKRLQAIRDDKLFYDNFL